MHDILQHAQALADKECTASLQTRLKRHMSNWIKISDILYSQSITEDTVLVMLAYELDNGQRPYIIKRLYSRYSSLRLKQERRIIQLCTKNPKKTQKSISPSKSDFEEVKVING